MITVRIFKGQPLNKGPEAAFPQKKKMSSYRTAVSQLAAGNFTLTQRVFSSFPLAEQK